MIINNTRTRRSDRAASKRRPRCHNWQKTVMGFTAKALTCLNQQASERITEGWASACIRPAEAGSRSRASREGSECNLAVLNSAAGPLPAQVNSPDNVRFVARSNEVSALYLNTFPRDLRPFCRLDHKIPLTAAEIYVVAWPIMSALADRQRLLDDYPRQRATLGVGAGDLLPNPRGDMAEDERVRVVGLSDGDRRSAVGGLADCDVERHLAEKLGAEPFGLMTGAAVTEDLAAAAAVRTQEIAHVLDDAEHRHVDLLEHVEPLAGVQERNVLRGRDNDRPGERHLLRHRQLRIASPRRHVDDHDVEPTPIDFAQHLLQGAHHHRPAPDHRRVLGDEKPHRHDPQPVILERREHLAVA